MKNELLSPTITRDIAIILVVALHVTDAVVDRTNYFGGISWFLAEYINTLSRIGVPIFIMLSGYLLLPKNYSFFEMRRRAIRRILVPFLIWFIVYFLFRHFWYGDLWSLPYLLNSLFFVQVFHLYFLIIILGLYLVSPWLSFFIMRKSQNFQLKVIVVFFIYGFTLTLIAYFLQGLKLINFVTIFTEYIGYYLLGGWLRSRRFDPKKNLQIFICFMLMAIISGVLTYLNWKWFVEGQKLFWRNGGQFFGEYLSPNIIIMSILGFTLLISPRYRFLKSDWLIKIIGIIGASSFGIYLIHPMIMDLLDHYTNLAVHQVTSALWLYVLEKISLVFLISFFVAWIITKLPFIRQTFGEYKK